MYIFSYATLLFTPPFLSLSSPLFIFSLSTSSYSFSISFFPPFTFFPSPVLFPLLTPLPHFTRSFYSHRPLKNNVLIRPLVPMCLGQGSLNALVWKCKGDEAKIQRQKKTTMTTERTNIVTPSEIRNFALSPSLHCALILALLLDPPFPIWRRLIPIYGRK